MSIRGCLSVRPRAVVEADPDREHFNFFNWHLGGYDRKQCDAGLQNYIPCNLGEIPDYYRRFIDPPEMMVVKTCPVDADGYFNFGPSNLWHGAVASRAKVVIVEADPAVPLRARHRQRPAREPGRLRHRRRRSAAAGASERGTHRRRSCGRATHRDARSKTARACRSGSARCRTPCARCCWRAACATSASTPRCSPTASSTCTRPVS